MITQTDAIKQAWAATDRTLDIVVTVDGKDYKATEINSLSYDAGAFTGDTLGIGSNYENSVTVEFSSVVEAFKQGLTVLPKVGILVNGKFEYTKLGTFIISEVNRDRNNNLTTIKALDQMCKLEGQYKPTVSATASPLDIIADIANQGGVAVNTGELQHLPTLPNIKRIEGQTLRTAIGWIAQLYDGFAAFDRDGKLTIRTTATPDYTITPGEYQQGGLTKNEVAYKTGGIKVTVNTKKTDDSGQEVDDTTTLQAGETTGSQIELTNDSMTSDLLATVWTGIKDITYYPYTLNWFGNPNLEAGDWVTLTDTQGNQFNVPVNQYTMAFNGGLESTISATQSSSTAGGYAYTGSAGSIKNMIEALQVRHTASGNNVYPPSYQGQPKNPKKDDVWYKQNGNNVEVWIYQEEDGKLSWTRTPLDGEVKAELQAMGKKTDEDLTRVKSELSSEAESQWQSAKTATSETDQRLTSLQAEQNASLADLHDTADSLHAAANSLHADADSMRASTASATSELGKDITATRDSLTAAENSLTAVDSSMRTATSETASELASTRDSLAAVDADMRDGMAQTRNDLANTRNSLKTATSETASELASTRSSLATVDADMRNGLTNARNDLANTRNSLTAVDNSLRTATSEVGNDLTSAKNSLAAVDADLRNGISKAGNDLSVAKTSLAATGNSLATATSELQRKTGQLSGSLSTADSMIMFNSNAIAEVKRTAGEISSTVSNIRVGGRNLLTNTRTLSDAWNGSTETVDGFTVAKATQTNSGSYDPIAWNGLTNIKSNTDYVLTFYAKASKQTQIYSYLYDIGADGEYKDGSTPNTLTTDYQRYTIHFHTATMPAGRTVNCLPVRMTENGVTAWIYGVQLEEGNTATQWQPNPADTDQAISKVSQTADAIRADLTNTKGDVASVKATANSLQSQITDNKSNIASVTQTAQGLTTRVSNAEGNVSGLQQTAKSLQSSVSDNAKNISAVKQTATSLQSQITDNKNNISSVKQTADSLTSTVGQMPAKWQQAINDKASAQVLTSNVDMNNLTTAGTYLIKDFSVKNAPFGAYFMATVDATSDHTRVVQRVKKDDSNIAYERSSKNDGWTAWERVATGTDVSSIQQTMAGITTRVANAEGDISNVKQTAADLQTSLANAKGDISTLKQTASGLETSVADNKKNISSVQQTATDLTSKMSDAQGNISALQQKADSLTNTISNGGRNLLNNSQGNFQPEGSKIDNYQVFDGVTVYMTQGRKYTVSAQCGPAGFYFSGSHVDTEESNRILLWLVGNGVDRVISGDTTDISKGGTHFTWNYASGTYTLRVNSYRKDNSGYAYHVQIEYGDTATPWQPSNGDISSLQQTAQGLQTSVSDNAKNISSIKQTADSLATRMTNAEGSVSSLKQTASGLQTDVADAKKNISSVQQTANSLSTRMSNAEGNVSSLQQTAKGLQSSVTNAQGDISQLQQDADGLNFTVSNGSQNLILNSGNPSTLDHWSTTGSLRLQPHPFWKNGTENLFVLSNTSSTDEKTLSSDRFQIEPNQTYTLSFYAFNNSAVKNTDVYYLPRKTGSSNAFDTAILLATNVKYSTANAQYVKFTFNSGDYNEGYIRFDNNASTTEGTAAELWLTDIQLEKGKIATAWSNSPGDIANLKITADGLTSKVADTQGDVSNLQLTAKGLQTQVTNNKDDVTSLQVKANGIRADLTNAKNDIASVKVKADSLTTSMANANDQISTLQHRADSITSTLSNGGVNLLSGTSGDLKSVTVTEWLIDYGSLFKTHILDNRTCTARVWIEKPSKDSVLGVWTNTGQSWNSNTIKANQSGYATVTFKITNTSYTSGHIAIGSGSGTVTFSYKELQIEYGDTATPWKPSNGDISSLQQTAQGLTADMKDAKGNISSLQTTAGGLTTRVSNTEGNISSLQLTAKELKATVGDDKTGLVSTVNAMPGKITSAITASQQAKVITAATDLHNMKTAGYYLLKGTLTNSPVDAWAFLRVITSDSGDRIYHRIWKDNASTVYTEEWTGSWSSWATHINSDNLKSNVITAINQSTEGVSITGAKITLDGNVNVAPGFTLSADRITAGTLSADRISGGTLNFSNITVNGLTANSISSGSISGQNLNINLDNGTVEFTKGNLHSTDGGFNISIDNKSFYLDTGSGSKLWIDNNGFHLQESATQHLWMNKDGLHNYTDANGNGIQINDTELKVLNSNNAGLIAKDGILQFSANPIWNSDNVYSGTLNDQLYGTIGFNSNLLSSSLNGIFIKGREGVVIGTSSYDGGSLFHADGFLDVGQAGSGINLPDDLNKPASFFTKSALTLLGGPTYPSFYGMSDKARVCIGCDTYYSHNGASMSSGGNDTRGNNISINARNTNIIGYDWVNIHCRNGRIALDAQWVHSYPTYNQTTSAGANVYVAEDGALMRSSSARKYKTDIQDANNDYGAKLIEFAPKKWIDKAEKKHYEEDPENNKKPGYYYGLIADDLDAAGLDMLVNYGAEGEVEGINYDRLAVALLPVIKSLKDQVASLKKQVKELTK